MLRWFRPAVRRSYRPLDKERMRFCVRKKHAFARTYPEYLPFRVDIENSFKYIEELIFT